MAISKTHSLISLINTLSRSEKRYFKLYVSRLNSNENKLFLRLYELYESGRLLTDYEILRELSLTDGQQLSNLKRHLYSQLLKSLYLKSSDSDKENVVWENLVYARILNSKNLPEDSLQFLKKCHNAVSTMDLVSKQYFNCRINDMQLSNLYELPQDAIAKMSEFDLQTQNEQSKAYYSISKDFLELGYSKSHRECLLRRYMINSLSIEKVVERQDVKNYCLSLMSLSLHHHSNFEDCRAYKYALKVHELIRKDSNAFELKLQVDLFILILMICKAVFDQKRYYQWVKKFSDFYMHHHKDIGAIGKNCEKELLYAQIQSSIYTGNFEMALEFSSKLDTELRIESGEIHTRSLERLVFQKAVIYSYLGNYEKSISLCYSIMNEPTKVFDKEILLYAKLLHVMNMYRTNNFIYVDNNLNNIRNAFSYRDSLFKPVDIILTFLRKGVKAHNFGLNDEIDNILFKLRQFKKEKFDKVSFYFYEIENWFLSVKYDVSVFEYLKKKQSLL